MEVSKEEWEEWKGNTVTKAFIKVLFNKREFLKEALAENNHSTDFERAIDIGQCIGIKDNIDYALHGFDYIEELQGDGV